MKKREELTNPNSCFSRAGMEEMVFVLLARDVAAPSTIRHWVNERITCGKNFRKRCPDCRSLGVCLVYGKDEQFDKSCEHHTNGFTRKVKTQDGVYSKYVQ